MLKDKSSSLYIHLPFCKSRCDYCDFFSQTQTRPTLQYINACINHTKNALSLFDTSQIQTIYIGGGTPSILPCDLLQDLIKGLLSLKQCQNIKEFSIELNVADITKDLLLCLKSNAVTRISVGVQSLNDKTLKAINRRGSVEDAKNALLAIQKYWGENVNFDLIAGLPFDTFETLKNSIQTLCRPFVSHICLYSLTLGRTLLAKNIDSGKIPYDQDYSDDLWLYGRDLLEANGFLQYEISNFAKPGCQCLHNMGYWQQKDYIGVGAGSTGTQGGGRYTNTSDIKEYTRFWSTQKPQWQNINLWPCKIEKLDAKTKSFEFLMLGFRTLQGVSSSEYKKRYGKDLSILLKNKDVIVTHKNKDTYFSLSKQGLLFLDKFLLDLL